MITTDSKTKINSGGGISYIRPEISLSAIHVEAGFAASINDKDFGVIDEAGKDLDINSGYDL